MKRHASFLLLLLLPVLALSGASFPFSFWKPSGAPGGPTPDFSFNFEAATPEIGNYSSLVFAGSAARSTAQAHAGTYSLEIAAATFSQIQVFNDTDVDEWASTLEGSFDIRWYYPGTWTSGVMLHQLDGKSNTPAIDTNDGMSLVTTANTGEITFAYKGNDGGTTTSITTSYHAITTGWHRVRATWKSSGARKISMQLDNQSPVFTTTALAATTCVAWHHQSIGNDRSVSYNFFLDDLFIYPTQIDGAIYATAPTTENCEGTGTPSGWTNTGSPDWDNTTSPLAEAQSFVLTSAAMGSYYTLPADVDQQWVRLPFNPSTLTGDPEICQLNDSSGAQVARWRVLSTGVIRMYNADGSTLASTAGGQMTAGTTYYVWCFYKRGTGANAVVELYFSTSAVRPGAPALRVRTGTATAAVRRVSFTGINSATIKYDNITFAENEIAD